MRVAIRVTCALLRGVGGKRKTIKKKKKQGEKETHNKRLKYDIPDLKWLPGKRCFNLNFGPVIGLIYGVFFIT